MTFINAGDNSWDNKIKSDYSIPDGKYIVFISEAFPDKSKVQGTPFIEISFQIHEPNSKYNGRVIRYQRFYLSEKALPRFIKILRTIGSTDPFNATDSVQVADALLDRICKVTVKNTVEDYGGEKKQKTQISAVEQLTNAERQMLIDEYGDTMLPPLATEEEVMENDLKEDLPF